MDLRSLCSLAVIIISLITIFEDKIVIGENRIQKLTGIIILNILGLLFCIYMINIKTFPYAINALILGAILVLKILKIKYIKEDKM